MHNLKSRAEKYTVKEKEVQVLYTYIRVDDLAAVLRIRDILVRIRIRTSY